DAPIASVAVNDTGTILASGAGDTLIWWLNDQGVWERDRIEVSPQKLSLNKDGNIVLIAGYVNTLELWKQPRPFAPWEQLQKIENFPLVRFIRMSDDAKIFAYIAHNSNQVVIYQMNSLNKWQQIPSITSNFEIKNAAMSSNGGTIITIQER